MKKCTVKKKHVSEAVKTRNDCCTGYKPWNMAVEER